MERKVKVAIYRTGSGSESVESQRIGEIMADNGYIRLTELVEVTFVDRKAEDLVPAVLASFDALAEQARTAYYDTLARIDEDRQQFLAITHQPEGDSNAP